MGVYKKIELLQSKPVFLLLTLLPALVFVVAKTWKSAFRYSILCSLVLPATVTLLYLTVAMLGVIKNGSSILPKIKMSISMGGTVWLALIVTIVPSLILGVLTRLGWNFFRRS